VSRLAQRIAQAGRVLSERTEDTGDDVWDVEHEFTWDDEGRPLMQRDTYMGFDAPYHIDTVYTYDERGRRARVAATSTDGSASVTEYVYDAADHLRETRTTAHGSWPRCQALRPGTSSRHFVQGGRPGRAETEDAVASRHRGPAVHARAVTRPPRRARSAPGQEPRAVPRRARAQCAGQGGYRVIPHRRA
jgi:YD repeat-containing protein